MHPFALSLCTLLAVAPAAVAAASDTTILASWNIRNLGWDNGKDYEALGVIGSHFDFISVQEVMSETGILAFRDALELETGTSWEHLCSDHIGRGSYREMYCFVWRDQKIEWVDGAIVYLDDRDVFAREPFSARFQTRSGFAFVATSVHSIYGANVSAREEEASALRAYRDWLSDTFSPTPIFLMGDFNLAPTNPAWQPLGEVMLPLIRDGATTISTIDGRFANLYDNIWIEADQDLPISRYGRLEFPHQVLNISHSQARESVSDHIPVWVELDPQVEARAFPSLFPASLPSSPVIPKQPAALRQSLPAPGENARGGSSSHSSSIIGNRNSQIYHLPECSSYGRVSPRNQVHFASENAARSQGYRRAKNC